MEYYWWFILALVLSAIEIITPGFVILWFGIAAGIVGVLDLFGIHNLNLQVIIFVILSLILVTLSRTFFKNVFKRSPGIQYKTNMDVMSGKTGLVTSKIDNNISEGRVTVDGQDWSARSFNDSIIEKDVLVNVVGYEGAKLIVSKNN
jgi:membrane protein implicated in regulation of membrane protease activity